MKEKVTYGLKKIIIEVACGCKVVADFVEDAVKIGLKKAPNTRRKVYKRVDDSISFIRSFRKKPRNEDDEECKYAFNVWTLLAGFIFVNIFALLCQPLATFYAIEIVLFRGVPVAGQILALVAVMVTTALYINTVAVPITYRASRKVLTIVSNMNSKNEQTIRGFKLALLVEKRIFYMWKDLIRFFDRISNKVSNNMSDVKTNVSDKAA